MTEHWKLNLCPQVSKRHSVTKPSVCLWPAGDRTESCHTPVFQWVRAVLSLCQVSNHQPIARLLRLIFCFPMVSWFHKMSTTSALWTKSSRWAIGRLTKTCWYKFTSYNLVIFKISHSLNANDQSYLDEWDSNALESERDLYIYKKNIPTKIKRHSGYAPKVSDFLLFSGHRYSQTVNCISLSLCLILLSFLYQNVIKNLNKDSESDLVWISMGTIYAFSLVKLSWSCQITYWIYFVSRPVQITPILQGTHLRVIYILK